MTRHTHDDGQLAPRHVDYDFVVHHSDDEPGLLVVTGVPAFACDICDEYWFDDSVGFGLSRLLHEHEPAPGEIRTIEWLRSNAA
jgi:hypothetical protein